MKKTIIFDLDNTILFLSNKWMNAYQEFIDKYNLNISLEDLYTCIGYFEKEAEDKIVSYKMICDYINKNLKITIDEKMFNGLLIDYANIPLLNIDKVYSTLEYLSKKYNLVGYSNWFTNNQIDRLKKYNLDKFFKKIYGWDILPSKPSLSGLKDIIKEDNIGDYTFIGDSINIDLELPKRIGMNTILYNASKINQNNYKEINDIEELKDLL